MPSEIFTGPPAVEEAQVLLESYSKIDPLGNLTVLHSFNGQAEGGMPLGRLLADSQGNLYGMTGFGGDPTCDCGTVFKLAPDGTLTVLHSFHGGTDGKAGGGFAHYG